jgi:hypothetical protein
VPTVQYQHSVAVQITKCLTESGFLSDISVKKGGGVVSVNVASNTSVKQYCGCEAGSAIEQRNILTDSRLKCHVC